MKTKPFGDKDEWETWWGSVEKSVVCYNKVKPLCLSCVLEDLVQLFLGREGSHIEIRIAQIFLLKYLYKSGYSTTEKDLFGAVASEIILQNWKDCKCLALIATYNANLISEAWNVHGREERQSFMALWRCAEDQTQKLPNARAGRQPLLFHLTKVTLWSETTGWIFHTNMISSFAWVGCEGWEEV